MPKQKDVPGLALRLIAAQSLQQVLKGASFSPLPPSDLPDSRDRALANKLITTALRRHGHLTDVLKRLFERGMPKKSGSFEAVLRLSLAQILYLPELGDHSALFLAGEATKRDKQTQHLSKLMNAILRRAQAEAADLRGATPERLFAPALVKTWSAAYGAEAIPAFARALIEGAPLDVTLKAEDPALLELLGARPLIADTFRIDARDKPVDQLPGYAEGRFWVQDAAAAIPVRLMGLAPGARVLDVGAAPGGKTAQLIKAGYAVTALDRDPARVARLQRNLARLAYRAGVVTADALDYAPAVPFDGILLDAPVQRPGRFAVILKWCGTAMPPISRAASRCSASSSRGPPNTLIRAVSLSIASAHWSLKRASCRPSGHLGRGSRRCPCRPAELDGWALPVTQAGFVRTHPGQTVPGDKGGTLDGFFVARFRRR